MVFVASILLVAKGLPGRLNSEAALINSAVGTNYRCPVSSYLVLGASRACLLNLPARDPNDADVVLLGNSHAQMYAPVWDEVFADLGLAGLLVPLNGCLPTIKINISKSCIDSAHTNLKEIVSLNRAKVVILGLTWSHREDLIDAMGRPADNSDNRALVAALDDLIDNLQQVGKQIVLIGPIASPGWDVASIVSRQLAFNHFSNQPHYMPYTDFETQFKSAIEHFETRRDISFVRPDLVQCSSTKCDYIIDGRSLFADGSHIAAQELKRFRHLFETALRFH